MIPNVVHFNFGLAPDFGGKPFSLIHYLAVASAVDVNRPDEVHMWYAYEPDSVWWERARALFISHKVEPPGEIHGNRLLHPAHKSDVLRLTKLYEHGGVYLDCDVICVRPFGELRTRKAVMGRQGRRGLCNATVLAEPGAEFLEHWLSSYRTFRSRGQDEFWDEHSVRVPMFLWSQHPWMLDVLPPSAFFEPRWRGMPAFVNGPDLDVSRDSYSVHLWETVCWNLFKGLTPEALVAGSSELARLTRRLVGDFVAAA